MVKYVKEEERLFMKCILINKNTYLRFKVFGCLYEVKLSYIMKSFRIDEDFNFGKNDLLIVT